MFENFLNKSEIRAAKESENKQIGLTRETAALDAVSKDTQYLEEMNQRSDLIKWQQELDIETLRHQLRSEYYDRETGNWLKRQKNVNSHKEDIAPLMTEEGIEAVEMALTNFMDENAKNMINSNLSEERILMMLKRTSKDLTHIFMFNYDKYFLNATPSNMTLVKRIIKNMIVPTAFRAINGWTKKQDNMGIRRIETFNEGNVENKKKMLWGF